jgi:hypothetical protein
MTMNKFEDRLLVELRAVVHERPAPDVTRGGSPARRRLPRARTVLATAAAAAAVAGTIVLIGGGGATPAYAVVRNADGSVTVHVRSLSDAAGLQQKLRAAGIPAVVEYTPTGKTCREPRGRRPATRQPLSMSVRVGDDTTFTIPRNAVGPGQTLALTTSVGGQLSSIGAEIVEGPVRPCQLVDAPVPPARGGTDGKDSGSGLSTGRDGESGPSTHVGP